MIKKLSPKFIKAKINLLLQKKFARTSITVPYEIKLVENRERQTGKIAIVTGGSGVIGRAIACRLAIEGAKVYVCGTSVEKASKVADEILALGGSAFPVAIDLTSETEISENVRRIFLNEGRMDILVNSAGGSSREKNATVDKLSTTVIDEILGINLRGTMIFCREVSKFMIEKRGGKIVCITSVIGEKGKAKFSEYAAAKAGLIAFVKSIAMELGVYGINVNCVSPGIVPRGEITDIQIENLKKTNYVNDIGRPEDIANMTNFLVSKEASFITGQNMIVDGGRSLGLKGD